MTLTLDGAVEYAARQHAEQRDKGGNSYIRHVLRVMHAVERSGGTEDDMIVAVLHDVVEDTGSPLADLEEMGLTENQLAAIDALTKRLGESYDERITRCLKNKVATLVKRCDIEDNLELWRIKNADSLQARDVERIATYIRSWHRLSGR